MINTAYTDLWARSISMEQCEILIEFQCGRMVVVDSKIVQWSPNRLNNDKIVIFSSLNLLPIYSFAIFFCN